MKTAPAGADAEEAHVLEEGREGGVAVGLQHNREDAARAREVPTPERVTGIVGQRRKEDTLNGGMSAQAFHYLHRRCSLALKARCQRAEAALRKKAVVRGNAKAEVAAGVLDLPVKPFVVHRHAAEDQVGVAADVIRQRLASDVGAVAQRLAADRRGPGAAGGTPPTPTRKAHV